MCGLDTCGFVGLCGWFARRVGLLPCGAVFGFCVGLCLVSVAVGCLLGARFGGGMYSCCAGFVVACWWWVCDLLIDVVVYCCLFSCWLFNSVVVLII